VGRKTASVVLGEAFGKPGVVVDIHVARLARRFGWTAQNDPDTVGYIKSEIRPAVESLHGSMGMSLYANTQSIPGTRSRPRPAEAPLTSPWPR
jgi:endonuclease III